MLVVKIVGEEKEKDPVYATILHHCIMGTLAILVDRRQSKVKTVTLTHVQVSMKRFMILLILLTWNLTFHSMGGGQSNQHSAKRGKINQNFIT